MLYSNNELEFLNSYWENVFFRNIPDRKYVIEFHINDNYEGGDYILYNPHFIIDKTVGVPYMFTSDREHEITEVTKGVRKSALIFINHEDLDNKLKLI